MHKDALRISGSVGQVTTRVHSLDNSLNQTNYKEGKTYDRFHKNTNNSFNIQDKLSLMISNNGTEENNNNSLKFHHKINSID